MKKKQKKRGAENLFGLLPNCIVKKKNCIATLGLYCKRKVGCRREGHNTKKNCIVTRSNRLARFVL